MKILLVDNGTRYKDQLLKLLSGFEVTMVPYDELKQVDVQAYELIVLSGGHSFPVIGNEDKLADELNLVRSTPVPLFGICYGFEVIARAFDSQLHRMEAKEKGVVTVTPAVPSDLFLGLNTFDVFESHRWVVSNLGPELQELAASQDGIEAFCHTSKPIYGVQFHPEMFPDATQGKKVFENFMRRFTKL